MLQKHVDILKSLVNAFTAIKQKTVIQYYKDVPISHVRLHKPYYYSIDAYLKKYETDHIISIIDMYVDIVEKYHPIADRNDFNIEVEGLTLTPEESSMWNDITQQCKIMLFERNLNSLEKFNDPIVVSRHPTDVYLLNVHPGRNRVRTMEYLYLKNKKEYYIDVIFYRKKVCEVGTYEGFLIDKEPIIIETLHEFLKLYGYETSGAFVDDLSNIELYTTRPVEQIWIAKDVGFTKEDYRNKLLELKEMLQTTE